jgi:GT2 family glycosyltransferase
MSNRQANSPLKKCIAIIPSIEGWHLLSHLLPTIDLPKEQIFVIDQGSHDGTEQKCRENGYGCIQMHHRATFTQAVNRGIKEALDRSADYVLVINNDVEFVTNVATQLLEHAENETNLGIISPRQIIVKNNENKLDVKRACWKLSKLEFAHEYDVVKCNDIKDNDAEGNPELLEADFCEFTCVLIRSIVFHSVGLLDEKYQFYHEDTDFCFRCQVAGFRCVYDQTALIKHYIGSTFEKQKIFNKEKLIKRNKAYFATDHLKHFVRFPFFLPTIACSWSTTNEFLYSYLNKYGLMSPNPDSPTLSGIAHPEMVDSDYLLTVWETSQIPRLWIEESKKFKHIFVPSLWNKQVFEKSGFTNVSVLNFGVEPDLFNPWGSRLSFPWAKSVLCVFQNQYRKGLDVTFKMWNQIRTKHPSVFLVMYGKDIDCSKLGMNNCFVTRIGNFIAKIDWNKQTALLQPAFRAYVSHRDMATLYRSCEIYLLNSRSEGFGYPILEAMACGSTCIIPNYGATKEFIQEGNCIFFDGMPIKADYSDKGFEDVGDWWEPDLKDLCSKVDHALHLDSLTTAAIGHRARQSVLSKYTWRHSMIALHKNLEQIQLPSNYVINQKGKLSLKYRKQLASLMYSAGHNFLKASITMELHGLKGVISKVKSKIIRC